MSAYYNEIDPYAAQWLKNLIHEGHIAPGDVDTRSIEDVVPADLRGYTQCHFFAGIGLWSLSLRQAGWPDHRPVWTGSCPCQPFSSAGKGKAFEDERHLWPAFYHLIRECKPATVFGEQVASKDGLAWVDIVQADMERQAYAFGAFDLCAAGFGAPHIRQRLYFLGHAFLSRPQRQRGDDTTAKGWEKSTRSGINSSTSIQLADTNGGHPSSWEKQRGGQQRLKPQDGIPQQLENPNEQHFRREPGALNGEKQEAGNRPVPCKSCSTNQTHQSNRARPTNGFWAAADWLFCRDGKWRPVEPGTQPLDHGHPQRVGKLRAYGNAICPPQAAEFIKSVMNVID